MQTPQSPEGEEPYRPRPDDELVEPFFAGLSGPGAGEPEGGDPKGIRDAGPTPKSTDSPRVRGWKRAFLWSLLTVVVAVLLHVFGD